MDKNFEELFAKVSELQKLQEERENEENEAAVVALTRQQLKAKAECLGECREPLT